MTDKNKWAYSDRVKAHFINPMNLLEGEESDYKADAVGMTGSPACGDVMKIFLKIKDDIIVDLKWKTYGCASAIASTSALSDMVTRNGGMSLTEAYLLKPSDIIKELEVLPADKVHCSVLGDKALQAAIDDYFARNNRENHERITKTIEKTDDAGSFDGYDDNYRNDGILENPSKNKRIQRQIVYVSFASGVAAKVRIYKDHNCQCTTDRGVLLDVKNYIGAKAGDLVEIESDELDAVKATFFICLLPIILTIIGVYSGNLYAVKNVYNVLLLRVIFGAAAFFISLITILFLGRKRTFFNLHPVITRIIAAFEKQ